jgi:hypothetical protein
VKDEISHCVQNDRIEAWCAVGKVLLWVLKDEILHCVQNDKGHLWVLISFV